MGAVVLGLLVVSSLPCLDDEHPLSRFLRPMDVDSHFWPYTLGRAWLNPDDH